MWSKVFKTFDHIRRFHKVILYTASSFHKGKIKGADLKTAFGVPGSPLFLLQSTHSVSITRNQAREEFPTPSERQDRSIFSVIPSESRFPLLNP